MASFITFLKLYAKANDTKHTKSYELTGASRWLMKKLEFRYEPCKVTHYIDMYVELTRNELLSVIKEYAENETLKHLKENANEIIKEIEADTNIYEIYQIHLAEWESGLD